MPTKFLCELWGEMQALAAKAAQKTVEKQVKNTVKDALPSKGPKTRGILTLLSTRLY